MQGGIQVYSIETSASYTDAGTRGRIATILRHEKRTSHTHLIVLECSPLLTLFMLSVVIWSKMKSSTHTQITHTSQLQLLSVAVSNDFEAILQHITVPYKYYYLCQIFT